jgi:hypothetical protein
LLAALGFFRVFQKDIGENCFLRRFRLAGYAWAMANGPPPNDEEHEEIG